METAAQSVHALTHSYITLFVVSMDGSLFSCLYICVQKAKGTFGPHVQQSMFAATDLIKCLALWQNGQIKSPLFLP
jgi:hypothetical protein